MHTRYKPRGVIWTALCILLLLALVLRLYSIDWDQGALFHPDERAILMKVEQLKVPSWRQLPDLLDADHSPLNPRWFSYGSLPLYMLKAVQLSCALFTNWPLFNLRLLGRAMSAFISTAGVGLIFLLGVTWLGLRVGLLAALFAAFTVIDIQLSHYFTVDTLLTFFGAAALFFLTRIACWGKRPDLLREIGLFQGRLGFRKVVLLQQDGIEEFSNVAGLQYIPFEGDKIEGAFYELPRVLQREGIVA